MTKKSDKDDSTNLKKATKIALISAVTSAIVIIIIIVTFYCKIWKPKDQQGKVIKLSQILRYINLQREKRKRTRVKQANSPLLFSTQINSTLLHSTLLYSTLLNSTLLYSASLFIAVLLCGQFFSVLFCANSCLL